MKNRSKTDKKWTQNLEIDLKVYHLATLIFELVFAVTNSQKGPFQTSLLLRFGFPIAEPNGAAKKNSGTKNVTAAVPEPVRANGAERAAQVAGVPAAAVPAAVAALLTAAAPQEAV